MTLHLLLHYICCSKGVRLGQGLRTREVGGLCSLEILEKN
jgi:hypothetical protein